MYKQKVWHKAFSSVTRLLDLLVLQILATAASNMAVDNMVEKLLKANPKLNILRIGHPARILPQASFPKLRLTQRLETHVLDIDRSARDMLDLPRRMSVAALKIGQFKISHGEILA